MHVVVVVTVSFVLPPRGPGIMAGAVMGAHDRPEPSHGPSTAIDGKRQLLLCCPTSCVSGWVLPELPWMVKRGNGAVLQRSTHTLSRQLVFFTMWGQRREQSGMPGVLRYLGRRRAHLWVWYHLHPGTRDS